MLQNLTKGKMVEWVVLLVALVALGLSIAAVSKSCKSDFADTCKTVTGGHDSCEQYNVAGKNCNPNGPGCLSDGTGCADCAYSPNCKCGGGSGGSPGVVPGGECQDIGDKTSCISNKNCVFWNGMCGAKDKVCEEGEDCGDPVPGSCQIGTCNSGVCKKMLDGTYSCQASNTSATQKCQSYKTRDNCINNAFCQWDTNINQCENLDTCLNDPCSTTSQCTTPCNLCSNGKCINTDKLHKHHSGGKDAKSGGKKATIGGGSGSFRPGSTYDPTGLGNGDSVFPPNGFVGGGTPSPSPSPSPSPGGGGKKSSDLPLILGLSGGGLVLVLAIAFLLMKKK